MDANMNDSLDDEIKKSLKANKDQLHLEMYNQFIKTKMKKGGSRW